MKRYISAGLISLLLGTSAMAAQTLTLASTPWLPFTGEKGGPRIVIELVQEALSRAGIDSTVKIIREGTLSAEIKKGTFEGSPAMWYDKDRASFLEFSTPILENRLLLVGKKGSDVSAGDLNALAGKRIGIVDGYAYGDTLENAPKTIFVKSASHQENLDKVMRGDIDYLLIEGLVLQQLLKYQAKAIKDNLEIGATPVGIRSIHFTLRKDVPNAADIIRKFDAQIKKMLTDGTYNRIIGVDWISVDADGDGKPELIPRSNHAGHEAPGSEYSVFYSSKGQSSSDQRIMIDGNVYTSWDRVPVRYKVDMDTNKDPGKPLGQWKF